MSKVTFDDLLTRAFEGSAEAAYELGMYYSRHLGDQIAAEPWFRIAAEACHVESMMMVAGLELAIADELPESPMLESGLSWLVRANSVDPQKVKPYLDQITEIVPADMYERAVEQWGKRELH